MWKHRKAICLLILWLKQFCHYPLPQQKAPRGSFGWLAEPYHTYIPGETVMSGFWPFCFRNDDQSRLSSKKPRLGCERSLGLLRRQDHNE